LVRAGRALRLAFDEWVRIDDVSAPGILTLKKFEPNSWPGDGDGFRGLSNGEYTPACQAATAAFDAICCKTMERKVRKTLGTLRCVKIAETRSLSYQVPIIIGVQGCIIEGIAAIPGILADGFTRLN